MIEYISAAVSAILVPVAGYLIKSVIETEKQVAAHEAMFTSLGIALTDIKGEQRDNSTKLDRLIEGNLRDATQANITHANELRVAAASAMVIVEKAKDSALAVVAEAARVAKAINPI